MADTEERKIKTVKMDGEEVTYEDTTQAIEREKWEKKKKASKRRNPFSMISLAKISTQGPER